MPETLHDWVRRGSTSRPASDFASSRRSDPAGHSRTAQSRKPGLSKTALGLAATDYGLQYAHIRALGTPRDIRYRRKIDHDEAAFRRDFLTYLATQDEAMLSLVLRAQQERCCLLCYEADARQCHRWFVAERAVEMSGGTITVVHLAIG